MLITSPNDPAFARPVSQLGPGETSFDQDGLTKREYFAAMAMQGFLAAKLSDEKGTLNLSVEVLTAKAAIIMADALIVELNKLGGEK